MKKIDKKSPLFIGQNFINENSYLQNSGDALRKRSDFAWKLSDNTFPHQIVRLLVLEQVYRAFKILRNEPYHK